jgi:pilus assembly protein Flp/PilA
MSDLLVRIYVWTDWFEGILKEDSGQDLVEYALVIAVICLGIVSGMGTLANGINNAMSSVSTNLNAAIS